MDYRKKIMSYKLSVMILNCIFCLQDVLASRFFSFWPKSHMSNWIALVVLFLSIHLFYFLKYSILDPLPAPSKLHVPLYYNSLNPICAAHMLPGVVPSTAA